MMEELRQWEKTVNSRIKDSIVYQCGDKQFHFCHYEATPDTIVMYSTTATDTAWVGGISLYDDELSDSTNSYFYNFVDSIWIQDYQDYTFFIAHLVNSGTGHMHKDCVYYINPSTCTLQQVRVVRATAIYEESIGLTGNRMIWKGEDRFWSNDNIHSIFYIWNEYDPNCCPTHGEVLANYELEVLPNDELVLLPKAFYFTPYTEDNQPLWSVGKY